MKIVKVPLRISFFCAGTDLPSFYHVEKGAALNATINKYINVVVQETLEDGVHLSSPGHDEVVDDVMKMEHHLTRETLKYHNKVNVGLTIASIPDIKCRGTGLGASSAYVVGLIQAISDTHEKLYLPSYLAEKACEIEIRRCDYNIGKQDQYAAAYGGFNLFEFHPDEMVTNKPIHFDKQLLENYLFLVDTGIPRKASDILKKQAEDIKADPVKFEYTRKSRDLAYEAVKFLEAGKFDDFGNLLDVSWQMKKDINKSTTTSRIDEIYGEFKKAGALGGKVLGAGGGGYMLFYVTPDSIDRVQHLTRLMDLKEYRFCFVDRGAQTVFNG